MVEFPSRRGITPVFGYAAPHPSGGGTRTLPIKTLPSTHYGMLRLPSARLAALRCLRLAIPSFRPLFVPASSGRELRIHLEFGGRDSNRQSTTGATGSLRFPSSPHVPAPCSWTPVGPNTPGHYGVPARPPLVSTTVAPAMKVFGARSHGIGTRCLRFAVEVSFPHARLASGCWPSFAGRDLFTRRAAVKGFRVRVSSSFLELA